MPDKPSKNEEEYFARREAELLRQQRETAQRAATERERRSHFMKCPKCGFDLITGEWHGVQIDQCTHWSIWTPCHSPVIRSKPHFGHFMKWEWRSRSIAARWAVSRCWRSSSASRRAKYS